MFGQRSTSLRCDFVFMVGVPKRLVWAYCLTTLMGGCDGVGCVVFTSFGASEICQSSSVQHFVMVGVPKLLVWVQCLYLLEGGYDGLDCARSKSCWDS